MHTEINTNKGYKPKKLFFEVLKDRFGINALDYEVPPHANTLLFTLGGITAISTFLTIISGILLTLWYVPTPEGANVSIREIMETVYLGSIIRGVHIWSAQATVVGLVLHILRVLFYGSYKAPREGNWIIGVLLFATMVGLFFTGTAIKWDQEGFEALEHAKEIAGTLGFGWFFEGGDGTVLSRMFSLHISILPLFLLFLLFLHMLLVKRHKISPLPWEKSENSDAHAEKHKHKHTFLQHFRTLVGYGYIVFGVVLILSILAPPIIGQEPLTGIEVTKPLWPFLWLYSVEEWAGVNGAWIAGGSTILALLAVPFIDRAKTQQFGKRKFVITVAIIVAVAILAFTFYAYFSTPVVHLDM